MASNGSSRTLADISVEGVQKRKIGTTKQNVYAIKVTWSDGTVNLIYRSYRNFHQLEEKLLQAFDQESSNNKTKKSKVIPKLQGKDRIKSDKKKRWEWIDNFNTELLDLPTVISESDIVEEFFTPTPDDLTSNKRRKEEEKISKANKKKERKRRNWKKRSTIKVIGSPLRVKKYRVLEDYEQQSDKEISLQGDTTVFVISKNDDGWWMVNSGEETGWAPGSYLQPIDPEDDVHDVKEAAIGEGEMFYSLKPYRAKEDDELSYPTGVTLQILRKNLDGWWTAIYLGRRGYVPALHLRKLQDKKKQRRHFSIKQLTMKGRRKPSRKISKARDTLEDKATVNDNSTSAKKEKTRKKISFGDELGIPSRSKMSVKRKRVQMIDQNQNAQTASLSQSEQKTDSESVEETQEIKVDEVGTSSSDNEELKGAQQPSKSPRRKKSNTFSGTKSFIPSIKVTRPSVKQRWRSLSLGSAPRGISSSLVQEIRTASQTFHSQATDKRHSEKESFDSPLDNGWSKSLQGSDRATSLPFVLDLEKESKHSSTVSENVSTSDSPSASLKRRKKGVVISPTSAIDGSVQLPTGPGDINNTTDTQTPLQASSQLNNEEKKPQQTAGNVLTRKKSQSLTKLRTPNLSSLGKLASSMPDIRQAGTDNERDWHPQAFTELHPKFQRKAIKIATKTIRSKTNQRPQSLVDPRLTEAGTTGKQKSKTFFSDDSSLAGKKKEQYNGITTLPRTKKNVVRTKNALSAHAYSDADLQSLSLRNNLFPLTRPQSEGSAVGSYPCSCSSGSLSELEFNSEESEDQIRWDWERAESESEGNEGYRNSAHDFDSVGPPPTYSLPECPKAKDSALPEPEIYQAVCGYEAENEQELSFLEGEELEVFRRAENGWWLCKIDNDKGWVPSNYLRAVSSCPVEFVPSENLRFSGNHEQFPLQ